MDDMKDKELDALLSEYTIHDADLGALQKRIILKAMQTTQIKSPIIFWKALSPMQIFAPSSGLIAASVLGFWLSFSGTVVLPQNKTTSDLLLDPIFYTEMASDNFDDDLLLYMTDGSLEQ